MTPDLTPYVDRITEPEMMLDDVIKEMEALGPDEWPTWADEIYGMLDEASTQMMRARQTIENYKTDEEQGHATYDEDGKHEHDTEA